jgi:hypothetical protein
VLGLDFLEVTMCRLNKRCFVLAVLMGACALSAGCKKRVPNNVVSDALIDAMQRQAPKTVSAMCGARTKGLTRPEISNVRLDEEKPTQGIAHVKGAPWLTAGVTLPSSCEGDVEFRFASNTTTSKKGKIRTNKTTWFLEHIKLSAVQTTGVTGTSNVEEDTEESE